MIGTAMGSGLWVCGWKITSRSAKDPMHALFVMPFWEGNNDTAATEDPDEVLEMLDVHMTVV
jgi:hypothetical protein